VIKKYANRKLYDTQNSRYITLEGISKLVREGHDIQVVERDTGRDLTSLVLSQIVMGEEKRVDSNGVDNLQERGQALLGYVRRTLSGSAALVSGEVERRRSELEDLVDSAVERAMIRLSIPSRRDIEALSARVERLERRLDALAQPATKSRTRTVAGRR
jgi:polyhydroxyalkanoate synthesis repressor PhaR